MLNRDEEEARHLIINGAMRTSEDSLYKTMEQS